MNLDGNRYFVSAHPDLHRNIVGPAYILYNFYSFSDPKLEEYKIANTIAEFEAQEARLDPMPQKLKNKQKHIKNNKKFFIPNSFLSKQI